MGDNTVSVLHSVQLLLNKQQQIWGVVYIHLHFSIGADTVVLSTNEEILRVFLRHILKTRQYWCRLDMDVAQLAKQLTNTNSSMLDEFTGTLKHSLFCMHVVNLMSRSILA